MEIQKSTCLPVPRSLDIQTVWGLWDCYSGSVCKRAMQAKYASQIASCNAVSEENGHIIQLT